MTNRLLVPIHTDGLFLEFDTLMTEANADFSRLPHFNGERDVNSDIAFLSEKIVSRPLQNQNLRNGAGLYLHWAMPDALTKGRHIANNSPAEKPQMIFPKTPNRWLVIRRGGDLDDKQWVVESDYLWPEEADLRHIGMITTGDLNQIGVFLGDLWALFSTVSPSTEETLAIAQMLQDGLADLDITLPDPLDEELTLGEVFAQITDDLEELLLANGKWNEILHLTLKSFTELEKNPDHLAEQSTLQSGLQNQLRKLLQVLSQAQAYLVLLDLQNQEIEDKLNKEINRLEEEKIEIENILSTGTATIAVKEQEITTLLSNSRQVTDVDIPTKNDEKLTLEQSITDLIENISALEGQKLLDEEELSLKESQSAALAIEIQDLEAEILPNQQRRDALLIEIGSDPSESLADLNSQWTNKVGEKEELDIENADLAVQLDTLDNGDDGLVKQNENLVSKTADKELADSDLKTLMNSKGLKNDDDPPTPQLTSDDIDVILVNLHAKNDEIHASENLIYELEKGVDFNALSAEQEVKAQKETEAEELRTSIIDQLDPDDGTFESNKDAARFYIEKLETLEVELEQINESITTLEEQIQTATVRTDELISTLIPALESDIADLDLKIEYETLVEELTPIEQTIQQNQESKTSLDARIGVLTTAISDAADLIAQQEIEKSGKQGELTQVTNELQALNDQLTTNDREIGLLRDDIFNLNNQLEQSKNNLVIIESELEFYQQELLKTEKNSETYLKQRRNSITIPIETNANHLSRQPFRYMGRVLPAEAYNVTSSNSFNYYDQLTVLGYGEPTFAALYSNCKSVFGFYDEEARPNAASPTNYYIFGWYAHAEDDFLKDILSENPADTLAALQKKANWTFTTPSNNTITAESSQVVCYSHLEFVGLGVNKTEAEEKFEAIIRANLAASTQALEGLPAPTDAEITTGATVIWDRLTGQSWITPLADGHSAAFDAILSTQKDRQDNAIQKELELSNDVTIILDIDNLEEALYELTTSTFKDSSVAIADTSSEALSSFLGHSLVPMPQLKQKKNLEFEIKNLSAQIQDLEDLVANGRADESELTALTDEYNQLDLQLQTIQQEIDILTPENQTARNQIEDQLETLFFTDELNARQLDIGAKMEEARLASRYNAVSTDHIWAIRSEGDDNQNAKDAAEAAKLPPSLNEDLAANLDLLNNLQKQFGDDLFQIESGKQRLFSDWYKYMLCSYPPADSSIKFPDIDEVRYFIQQKDIVPLYERIMNTGEIVLDHLTAPTHATDRPSFSPDDRVIAAIKTELGKTHELPIDPLAKRLASEINELIRQVSWNNIEQLKLKEQNGFDEINDWPTLLAALDTADDASELGQLKTSLGVSVELILEDASANQYQIRAEDKEIVRTALNDVLLQEINALNDLYLGLIQPVDLFLTTLQASDINNWDELVVRLQTLGIQNPDASIWLGLPEDIRNKLSSNIAPLSLSLAEKSAILEALHSWIEPRPENVVKTKRSYLESLFPNSIHPAEKTMFVLKRISAPRFWEPKEPAILIAGDIIESSNRFGKDGRQHRQGFLECTIHTVDEVENTYLQEPSDFDELLDLIIQKHTNASASDTIGYQTMFSNPWNPFQLEWEVELCPLLEGSNATDGDYHPDYLFDNYDLKVDAVEMRIKLGQGKATTGRSPNIYTGRSLMTTEASKNLDIQLKAFLFNDQDKVDQAIAEASFDNPYYTAHKALETLESGIPIQSQVLSGFNQAMLMFRQSLQLPIDDPIGFEDYQGFTKLVASLIGYSSKFAPQPLTDFCPIRTGELNLNQIRVVDTFGQYRQLDFFDPDNGADVMGTAMQASKTDGIASSVSIPLTPRLAQPARLDFRWMNSTDEDMEMNDHTDTNPICGWIMANYADLSLMIFDDSGQYLGAIEQEDAAEEEINDHPDRANWARWRSAVGKPDIEFTAALENVHLRTAVEFIRQKGKTYVEEFTDITDATLEGIAPENIGRQDATVLLMGRPIALVRAAVNLRFKEIHAVQQSWEAFLRDRLRKSTDFRRETDDYSKVQIPVRIGAASQYDDGLIAYWKTTQDGTLQADEVQINALFGDMPSKDDGSTYHSSFDFLDDNSIPFTVSADESQEAQYLSMLIDPYAKVHGITGILPVKAIDIPSSHFEKALQAINLTFLAGPVLSPAKKILAPLPNLENKHWAWIEKADTGDNWEVIQQEPAIAKSTLAQAFSNLLWNQLVLRNWIDEVSVDQFAAAAATDRKTLDLDFIILEDDLIALLEAIPTLTKQSFTDKAAEPGGLSNVLWDVLTDQENVNWLVLYSEDSEMASITANDERKNQTLDIEVLGVNYNGLHLRIQEIIRYNQQGIFELPLSTTPPEGRLWLREGWLQLQ